MRSYRARQTCDGITLSTIPAGAIASSRFEVAPTAAGRTTSGRKSRLRPSSRMEATTSSSRAQSRTPCPIPASAPASAVPQLPAPMTATSAMAPPSEAKISHRRGRLGKKSHNFPPGGRL